MSFTSRATLTASAVFFAAAAPSIGSAQTLPEIRARDSVTIIASDKYRKGGFHRFLFGDNYRDIWATPVKAPVLDLADFAGGLTPTEIGGGKQTRALRFKGANGREYSFRPVYKALLDLPDSFRGTIIWNLVMDARSASHPTAPVSAPPVLTAVGLLQAPAALVALPDDARLGQYQKEFGGILGTIEERPRVPDDNPSAAFGGAKNIEDGEDMLERINEEPVRWNARGFLKAVLIDALLGDNDRHAGQWSWAKLADDGEWQPIPRDRDKVFIDYEGFLVGLGRGAAPTLVRFGETYPRLSDLFDNGVEFERRMLNELEKPAWDSVVAEVKAAVTDQVLEAAIAAQPREYDATNREILATLKARRNAIGDAANRYYAYMAHTVDLHATDKNETATVEHAEGMVTITLSEEGKEPYYRRRFNTGETREIRLYLHGGDDAATVTGSGQNTPRVRVIGGNGNNRLADNSTVGGRSRARLYDNGQVSDIRYELDSAADEENDEPALPYNRRPLLRAYGREVEPVRDRGTRTGPIFGVRTGHGLGFTPKVGISRTKYGFRKIPYASMQTLDFAYSTGLQGFEVGFETDNRFEMSGLHVTSETRYSQIGVADFRGFGNEALDELAPGTPGPKSKFYRVTQSQYLFNPSIGYSFGPRSDVSVGPIVRYTRADSTASQFISTARPYGFRRFGQAGVQMRLYHDTRVAADTGRNRGGVDFRGAVNPPLWGKLELNGSVYPAAWDVESTYENVEAVATAYLTFPVLTNPVLALRAGGQKLFGDFPWFDAAFIGGSGSLRTEQRQRYAGDASAYGSAELRLPIAKFPFILPLDVGVLGFADMARVYLDGESPGGWHRGMGGGLWIGVVNPGTNVTILATDNPDRRVLVNLGFAF
jgi:hypothetical protein